MIKIINIFIFFSIFVCADEFVSSKINHNGLDYFTIKSPMTGRIWLDRNLGALNVCTSRYEHKCYGNYYQWGRKSFKNSKIMFTINHFYHSDWLKKSDNTLWQKDTNKNNPCPSGFRIPTINELSKEMKKQKIQNKDQILNISFLKLPSSGYRNDLDGTLHEGGTQIYIWSSTVDGEYSKYLHINTAYVGVHNNHRGFGYPVRCIKDEL